MSDRMPITAPGLKRVQEELKHLSGPERLKIAAEIEVARAHGDLRENAEYHAAKEKQSHIEGRIAYLNGLIANAEVIDVTSNNFLCVLFQLKDWDRKKVHLPGQVFHRFEDQWRRHHRLCLPSIVHHIAGG